MFLCSVVDDDDDHEGPFHQSLNIYCLANTHTHAHTHIDPFFQASFYCLLLLPALSLRPMLQKTYFNIHFKLLAKCFSLTLFTNFFDRFLCSIESHFERKKCFPFVSGIRTCACSDESALEACHITRALLLTTQNQTK